MIDKIETVVDGSRAIIWYIVIGIMSGIIQMGAKEHKHKSRFEKFCVWLTSFSFAVFVTPTFIWLIEIGAGVIVPESVKYGICFFSGQFGEKTLIVAMRVYKSFNWKEVLLTILTKKK